MTTCRAPKCNRKPIPNSVWCNAHYGQLIDRVLRRAA